MGNMTRFIISLAILVMTAGAGDTVSVDISIHLYQPPDSLTQEFGMDSNARTYIHSLPGIGYIHPGECLTVDSNHTLIRCPTTSRKPE